MMLRRICLSTATTVTLALAVFAASGCQRASEASSSPSATGSSAPEAAPAQEKGAVAAVAEPRRKAEAAAGEESMSCGKDKESCSGGCDQWDEAAAEVLQRELPDDAVWRTLEVSGMHCGGCERRIVAHVGQLDGVLSVEADAELGVVRVAVAPEERELTHAAAARIRKLGYHVER